MMANRKGQTRRSKEGGWGWMIVVGVFFVQILTAGQVGCLGLFLVEWLEEFQASVTTTSWVVSIVPLLTGFLSPISNVLAVRFGHRRVCCVGAVMLSLGAMLSSFATNLVHLYLTFGLLMGVGVSLVFAPSIMIVGVYFKERFTLANALSSAGIGIGQMTLPLFFAFLISSYGWRGALFISGAFNMNVFVCACLFRPKLSPREYPSKVDSRKDNEDQDNVKMQEFEQERSDLKLKRPGNRIGHCCKATSKFSGIPELCYSPHYPITIFTAFANGVCGYCVSVYIAPRAIEHGFSKNQGAFLLSLIGVGGLAGRIIHAILIDLKYASTQAVYFLSLVSIAVELLLTPIWRNFALLAVFSLTFGISAGISSPLVYVISREVSPTYLLAPVLGFTVLLYAAGNVFGTVFGGLLFDLTADYGVPFYASGGLMTFAAVLFLPTLWWLHKNKNQKETHL